MSGKLSVKVVLLASYFIAFTEPCWCEDIAPTGSSFTTENGETSTRVDPSHSLCEKLTDVLSEIHIQNGPVCSLNSACSGLECKYNLYSMHMWILPCAAPPAIRLSVFNVQDGEPFDNVLVNTTQVFGLDYAIDVAIHHQDEGFEVEIHDNNMGNLFPRTKFSTDPSLCLSSVCDAIRSSISRPTVGTTCSPTKQCDGARCVRNLGIKINANLRIVQCHDPPAVQLVVENPFNEEDRDLINDVFTSTSNRTVLNFYDMFVTVHQLGSGIGVEITGQIRGGDGDPDEGGEIPTDIDYPFYGSGSGFPFGSGFPLIGPDLPTTDGSEEVDSGGDKVLEYTFFPVDPTKPECEVFSLTCLGLEGVVDRAARSNVSCQTNPKCNGVVCLVDAFQNGVLFPLSIVFNTCRRPMASVNLVLLDPDSRILLEREMDKSGTIHLFDHDIIVTVEHFPAEEKPYPSVGFAIDLVLSADEQDMASEPMKIIRYSEVPIICDGTTNRAGGLSTCTVALLTLCLLVIQSALW